MIYEYKKKKNQIVENAGVAFVKGADERNGFFEKKVIYDEQVQTKKGKGLRISGTNGSGDELRQVTRVGGSI